MSTLTVTAVGYDLSDSDRERFERIVGRVDVLPYGLEEAKRATREHRELRRDGTQVGAIDAMIAATAIEANRPVVTRNVAEFQRTGAAVTPY
ncbi:type II toxin-antitoxin system VapC family toxin [Natrialbaceae archaeon AArc-T1-2]|uniref:type II toxin-antitoxin system VapC family toxin n=1 Tax=Natrialbaceae archaeon AArc-T1-2 TaxID=3053904 RepID=UPI00255AE239|nr:type II toxin-antitoxin system VapC family toxin [Natrialbaceae archaeon AArc-T1-2]WIV66056.1 type II toxin-antitoxin system VapC family toxin [Natrialbaceae archaeon AArc-T1-2]